MLIQTTSHHHLLFQGNWLCNLCFVLTLFAIQAVNANAAEQQAPWLRDSIFPAWQDVAALRTVKLAYNSKQTPEKNGQRLFEALQNLRAGDRLKIAAGRYVFTRKVSLDLQGTAEAPIRIEAADPAHPPHITRPDARQNLLNLGERKRIQFVLFRGLELTGSSLILRLGDCRNIWIDQCHIHHGEHGGITANINHTEHLYITRNHMHHFLSGTGEAMYLGANRGKAVMSYSVIAQNHVHDCGGEQGDGIEVKQGSYNNWIVSNHIHDTKYPCLIAYGTNGKGINLIEKNILYNSQNQTLQVQGEAIVRNNLIMNAGGAGFSSTDHQGKTKALTFVHNTIINSGPGANLSSWADRDGMIFANNAIYSRNNAAVRFPKGSRRVLTTGNVVVGRVEGSSNLQGFKKGKGLADFVDVTWDANKQNAEPSRKSSLLRSADPKHVSKQDIRGRNRMKPATAGAFEKSPE